MDDIFYKQPIYNKLKDKWHFFVFGREKSFIDRRRAIVFGCSSFILLIGIVLNQLNITGPTLPYFKTASALLGVIILCTAALYYYRRISLSIAISLFCISSQAELLFETVYCALNSTPDDMGLIIGNMLISAGLLLIGIVSFLRVVPLITSAMAISGFAISIYFTQAYILEFFFIIFVLVYIVIALIGRIMTSTILQLEKEKSDLKNEQQEVLDFLHLTPEQMQIYLTQHREGKLTSDLSSNLLESMNPKTRQLIQENRANHIQESERRFARLKERLPELSHSELEICEQILNKKTLKQTAEKLDKTTNFIVQQRASIQAKLGLNEEDNLLEMLRERMNAPL